MDEPHCSFRSLQNLPSYGWGEQADRLNKYEYKLHTMHHFYFLYEFKILIRIEITHYVQTRLRIYGE
jgi:hypothetical protein